MRITNNMLINKLMYSLNSNLSRMSKVQNQLATGKKISVMSDDPLIASKALKLRTGVSEVEQYLKNIEDGLSWAEVTDGTLDSIGQAVTRLSELAIQASNGPVDASQRISIQEEAKQLLDQLINLSNSTYAGRHIFSGFKTNNPLILSEDKAYSYTDLPVVTDGTNFRLRHDNIGSVVNIQGNVAGVSTIFTPTATPGSPSAGEYDIDLATGQLIFNASDIASGITNANASYNLNRLKGEYNADVYSYSSITQTAPMQGEDIKFEVGVGNMVDINVIGTKVFGSASGAQNVGSNILAVQRFINALGANDIAAITSTVSELNKFSNEVLEQRAVVGARTNRLELTSNRLEIQYMNFSELMSKNEDADIAEVIMRLKSEESIYNASLNLGARLVQPTLLDYLR